MEVLFTAEDILVPADRDNSSGSYDDEAGGVIQLGFESEDTQITQPGLVSIFVKERTLLKDQVIEYEGVPGVSSKLYGWTESTGVKATLINSVEGDDVNWGMVLQVTDGQEHTVSVSVVRVAA